MDGKAVVIAARLASHATLCSHCTASARWLAVLFGPDSFEANAIGWIRELERTCPNTLAAWKESK